MSIIVVILILFIFILAGVLLYLLLGGSPFSNNESKTQINQLLTTQRNYRADKVAREEKTQLDDVMLDAKKKRVVTSDLTLEKKLRYARWRLPPIGFYLISFVISLISVLISTQLFGLPIIIFSIFIGPIIMGGLLKFFMKKRFNAFDKDYPAFLLNTVSMLKIGMNTMTAIQSASDGLEDNSLVKEEVTLMLDRLKLGVSEDKSIGAFGEDVSHPEIELFVQAVILSRRLGGNLSDTLDRLASQVRKRQHFRKSAEAAVSLQKGSIWVLLGIMSALEIYILFTSPDLITVSFTSELGILVWEGAVIMIITGILWLRSVTNIKV